MSDQTTPTDGQVLQSPADVQQTLKNIELQKQKIALLKQLATLNIESGDGKPIDTSALYDAEQLLNSTEALIKKSAR